MGRKIAVAIAITLIAGGSWFGLKYYRCERRSAVFRHQIESIKKDALEQLKIGTGKAEVSRFFDEHRISFNFVESKAIGTLRTSGCAPLGCGTDSAIIGIRVNLDEAGAVAQEPTVFGMYTDCL